MTATNVNPRQGLWQKITGIVADLNARPLANYTMIMISVAFLTGLGVIMVFSSSMTWSVVDGSSVWDTAIRQVLMVIIGLFVMWAAMRIKPASVRRIAPWLMLIAVILLVAVLIPGIGTGREEVGSQSWIVLGPLRLQPSEFAKVAIAIWGAAFLGVPDEQVSANRRFMLFTGVAALMVLLIAAEGDAGMALTFFMMVGIVVFFAGIDWRYLVAAGGLAALGAVALMMGGGFRSQRFTVYFDALFGRFEDTHSNSFQSYQGFLSLADGSAFGVGLGQSRAKWFYLPEAKNDFIFAIIGEEIGLWGGALVILAFLLLGFYGIRCAMNSHNKFMSLLAASLTASVVAQAFINISYVIGLVPVTGIQLPMLSAGGTSAIITLGSMGLLASCARHEPEAISAMQNYGRPLVDQLLRLKEPKIRDVEIGAGDSSTRAKSKEAPRREPVTRRVSDRDLEPRGVRGGSVDSRSEQRRQSRRQETRTQRGDGVRQTPLRQEGSRVAQPKNQQRPVRKRKG
ncbi:putative peptidoglycan glycosyltransferase FtsW [Corynebacterium sp. H128]|uniref:FtsW/RodA/SpoVE family cell cycle protein n=1 Tax=Corynebacterium sp. H128 TaxID=3133427 RepID=UPI0030A24E71